MKFIFSLILMSFLTHLPAFATTNTSYNIAQSQIDTIVENGVYGGFIQNRKTKDRLVLKCVETEEQECTGFQFYLASSGETDPAKWQNLKPEFVFHKNDLEIIETSTKSKMKYRVDPQGLHLPVFPLTMWVWMLAEQNRTGGGADLPIEAFYVISVPIDVVTFLPITIGTAASFGVKQGIIAIQRGNIKKAFDALDSTDSEKIKKLGNRNFQLIMDLVKKYEPKPIELL